MNETYSIFWLRDQMGRKFHIWGSNKPERVDETMCMERAGKVGGVQGPYGKRHGALLHQKVKKRRKEWRRAQSSVSGEAQEDEEPQRGGSLCTGWETSRLQGRLREMGQTLRLKSVRRTCTGAAGKRLGVKEQESKGWGGAVRSQLKSDNGSSQ